MKIYLEGDKFIQCTNKTITFDSADEDIEFTCDWNELWAYVIDSFPEFEAWQLQQLKAFKAKEAQKMTDEQKQHIRAFETIFEAMRHPREKCAMCGALTHYLQDGICDACQNAEGWDMAAKDGSV